MSLKHEIIHLKEIIAMAVSQIKNAITSLLDTNCTTVSNAMDTEAKQSMSSAPNNDTYSNQTQFNLPALIKELKNDIATHTHTQKPQLFSVISLCRSYKEDPHWFIIEITSGTGTVQIEESYGFVGSTLSFHGQGFLVAETSLAFRLLWLQCHISVQR